MPSLRQRIEALESRSDAALPHSLAVRQRETMCGAVATLRAELPEHGELQALADRIRAGLLSEADLAVMAELDRYAVALAMTRADVALTAAGVLDKF